MVTSSLVTMITSHRPVVQTIPQKVTEEVLNPIKVFIYDWMEYDTFDPSQRCTRFIVGMPWATCNSIIFFQISYLEL